MKKFRIIIPLALVCFFATSCGLTETERKEIERITSLTEYSLEMVKIEIEEQKSTITYLNDRLNYNLCRKIEAECQIVRGEQLSRSLKDFMSKVQASSEQMANYEIELQGYYELVTTNKALLETLAKEKEALEADLQAAEEKLQSLEGQRTKLQEQLEELQARLEE